MLYLQLLERIKNMKVLICYCELKWNMINSNIIGGWATLPFDPFSERGTSVCEEFIGILFSTFTYMLKDL